MTRTPQEIEAIRAQQKALKAQRIETDRANAQRDAPIRARFHAWLVEAEGYEPQATPAPGCSYPGAHTQIMWECYLAATLAERGSK